MIAMSLFDRIVGCHCMYVNLRMDALNDLALFIQSRLVLGG